MTQSYITRFVNHEPGCDGSVTVPDAGFGGQDMTYECEHPSHRVTLLDDAELLTAYGDGPLLDPDCRDGKHGSCPGAPCECACHYASVGSERP